MYEESAKEKVRKAIRLHTKSETEQKNLYRLLKNNEWMSNPYLCRKMRQYKKHGKTAVNNQIIVNVGGLGFDGHVAKLFNEGTNRGNISYAKLIIKELLRFKEQDYSLNISNTITEGKAFMIAFANGSEFGNRFIINPGANHDNGKLNLVVVRKPPLYKLPALLYAGFKGTLGESKYYKRYLIEEFELSCPGASLHRDGEVDSYDSNSPLTIRIIPKALDIIY